MSQEQSPCCNAAGVMARTAKEMLAEKEAEIIFLKLRLSDHQDEIDSLREKLSMALSIISSFGKQRQEEIVRILDNERSRAAAIQEMRERMGLQARPATASFPCGSLGEEV